jgi:hydrogenase large subunit
MARKIVVDPVTRIEGHLKIEVEVEGGKVVDARSTGTLWRGWEVILQGRDPRDASQIAQRICGVCPTAHSMASSRCLDDAFGVKIPTNGRLIRNLIFGSNFIQSHVLHFFHLTALDYVKGPNVAPFVPRYEGSNFYRLDQATNEEAVRRYLKALQIRNEAHQMLAVFGGHMPHVSGIVAGGATEIPTVDKVTNFLWRLRELQEFIDEVYLPTVYLVASAYKDYLSIGTGCKNFLCYGLFDLDDEGSQKLFPAGVFVDGKLLPLDPTKISEDVKHAWYKDETSGLHPSAGATVPDARKPNGYTWLKAPRYDGRPVEVGPLARAWIANPVLSKHANAFLGVGPDQEVRFRDLGEAAFSVLGRHAARAEECRVVAYAMEKWLSELKMGERSSVTVKVPQESKGAGMTDAPRGALGHWISIQGGKIDNYQAVVPTTWNSGPRDDKGVPGPMEQALLGTQVSDPDHPIELVRVVRSFDPCLACAIHVIDARGLRPGVKIL